MNSRALDQIDYMMNDLKIMIADMLIEEIDDAYLNGKRLRHFSERELNLFQNSHLSVRDHLEFKKIYYGCDLENVTDYQLSIYNDINVNIGGRRNIVFIDDYIDDYIDNIDNDIDENIDNDIDDNIDNKQNIEIDETRISSPAA